MNKFNFVLHGLLCFLSLLLGAACLLGTESACICGWGGTAVYGLAATCASVWLAWRMLMHSREALALMTIQRYQNWKRDQWGLRVYPPIDDPAFVD